MFRVLTDNETCDIAQFPMFSFFNEKCWRNVVIRDNCYLLTVAMLTRMYRQIYTVICNLWFQSDVTMSIKSLIKKFIIKKKPFLWKLNRFFHIFIKFTNFPYIFNVFHVCFFFSAFSWFSLCEYIIACANMAFHATVVLDFPNHQIQVAPFLSYKQDWSLKPFNKMKLIIKLYAYRDWNCFVLADRIIQLLILLFSDNK